MTLNDSADEMTFDLLEVPIVDKDIEGAVDNVTLDGNQYTDYLWLKKQFVQKWSILCDDEYTRLRGFYTRQFENADVPSYRLYYGDDIIRNSTLSGERIELSISGVADGTMSLTQMDGSIEQTTYAGKNLLNVTATTTTNNGVTFTVWADGTITTMGTASALVSINLINGQNPYSLPAGTYTLSGCPTGGSDSKYRIDINNGADGDKRDYGSGATFTLTSTLSVSNVRIRVASGTNMNGLTFKPMISAGSTAQAYEPYVGGIPAPNPNYPQPISTVTGRQTVTITGKNLFNPTATPWGSKVAYNSSGTQVWWDGYYGIIEYQPVQPNTQYTFSNSAGKPILYGLVFYDANKTTLSTVPSATTTFTTPANCAYIRFAIQNSSAPTWTQIELGNQASAFEPYKGQNYEINLGKNLWGGLASDFTKTLGGITFVTKADGTITNTAGATSATAYSAFASDATSNGFTKTIEAGTYCISGASGDITIDVCDSSGTTLATDTGDGKSFTTTAKKTVFVRIRVASGKTLTAGATKPQLEKGSTASSYSAYFEPIELCKIGAYQDRIYKENGKWWLEKQTGKVVLNGSEDWHKSSNTQVDRYWYNIYSGEVIPSFHQIYSDKFFYQYNVPTVNAMWVDVYQTLERLFVNYAPYNTTTVTDLKTWLASNPTIVYYPLATPTTTEITNEALVEQLEALQDEAISVGQHNIYTDTPNALPTLTFDLTEYLSKSTTIIPETAVRLTLTDGGVINACGCRKDIQLTMRETIE